MVGNNTGPGLATRSKRYVVYMDIYTLGVR